MDKSFKKFVKMEAKGQGMIFTGSFTGFTFFFL